MFAYCLNNPINHSDPSGMFGYWDPDIDPNTRNGWNIGQMIADWISDVADQYPSEEEHYERNSRNPDFPDQYDAAYFADWDDNVSANCHQFSSPSHNNRKFVSDDGHYEVIYDSSGREVIDPRDVGTYNFISPVDDPIGHFIVDVIPWIIHGNSPDDSTTLWERMLAFPGIYLGGSE